MFVNMYMLLYVEVFWGGGGCVIDVHSSSVYAGLAVEPCFGVCGVSDGMVSSAGDVSTGWHLVRVLARGDRDGDVLMGTAR